jgi:hypothetical protein
MTKARRRYFILLNRILENNESNKVHKKILYLLTKKFIVIRGNIMSYLTRTKLII